MTLEQEVNDILHRKEITFGTVESATGGLIANLITNVPGSSPHFKGLVVAYSNEIKIGIVGVKAGTIEQHGAVSAPVAEEMAAGGARLLGVDICVADTGIAGPGGATPDKPVGLFYLGGLSYHGQTFSRRHVFHGDRVQNKAAAAQAALEWVREYLRGMG